MNKSRPVVLFVGEFTDEEDQSFLRWFAQSRTTFGLIYTIDTWGIGHTDCTCQAKYFRPGEDCAHIKEVERIMNINASFPSKWLRAGDLEEGDTVFTIADVTMESVGSSDGDEEYKPCLKFEETAKGLVLNKTNSFSIQKALGTPETDEWIGRKVALFPTQVDFGGRSVEAIRVRLREPKGEPRAKDTRPLGERLNGSAAKNDGWGSGNGAVAQANGNAVDWTAFWKLTRQMRITDEQLTDLCGGLSPEAFAEEDRAAFDGMLAELREAAATAKA